MEAEEDGQRTTPSARVSLEDQRLLSALARPRRVGASAEPGTERARGAALIEVLSGIRQGG